MSTDAALINPNYFMLDYDTDVQVGTGKVIRELVKTGPVAELISEETEPTLAVSLIDSQT